MRNEMIDAVVRRYGHESPEAILFCEACEKFNLDSVVAIYKILMN